MNTSNTPVETHKFVRRDNRIGHIVSDFQDNFLLDLMLHHIYHNVLICSVKFHEINCQRL